MIVDTSAVMAIALREPGWDVLLRRATEAEELLMSCGTLQELLIVADRKGILSAVNRLLNDLDLDYIPIDQRLALEGLTCYQRYGKGSGHAAQLNYGDCFAYALAKSKGMPLLLKGLDFAQTDIEKS